jgi:hypothetical protein
MPAFTLLQTSFVSTDEHSCTHVRVTGTCPIFIYFHVINNTNSTGVQTSEVGAILVPLNEELTFVWKRSGRRSIYKK